MSDLTTSYLGLKLKNPLIAASSGMTAKVDTLVKLQDSGAGAVVLKSLFEEQILADSRSMTEGFDDSVHADAYDFFRNTSESYFLDGYLEKLEEAKKRLEIPVIASVNCVSDGKWLDYAARFEQAGADALELNAFVMPTDRYKSSEEYEDIYLNMAEKIKGAVSVPVAMKLAPHYTGMARFIDGLRRKGLDGLVLFNRFYRPDVDIKAMKMVHAPIFSAREEISLALQWIALLSGEIEIDFAASTGVHDAEGVIKQVLVGAKAVQLCTALYKNGPEYLALLLKEIETWMAEQGFSSLADFQGKLCQEASDNPAAYERSQYIKAAVGIS